MARPNTIARVANSFLHILRPHPSIIAQYQPLFQRRFTPLFFLTRICHAFFVSCFNFFRSNLRARKFRQEKAEKFNADIVFVTHNSRLVNDLNYDEVYGTIPSCLSKMGFNVAVLHINHTTNDIRWDGRYSNEHSALHHHIFQENLGLYREAKIFIMQLVESFLLIKHATFLRDHRERAFLFYACYHNLRGSSLRALRIYFQTCDLVNELKPRFLITPFEGHSFERLLFKAANDTPRSVISVAFQHAPLFKGQFTLLDAFSTDFSPTCIMIPGSRSRTIFRPVLEGFPQRVIQVGSPKISHAVSFFVARRSKARNLKTCLILCEGFLDETNLLWQFAKSLACRFRRINFTLRLHPSFSLAAVCNVRSFSARLPTNLKLSTSSLAIDASSSQWCIYRGSGSIIEALYFGVVPIYFDARGENSVDPLWLLVKSRFFAMRYGFFRVRRLQDLDKIFLNSRNSLQQNLNKAKRTRLARTLWSPLNVESFSNALGTLALR